VTLFLRVEGNCIRVHSAENLDDLGWGCGHEQVNVNGVFEEELLRVVIEFGVFLVSDVLIFG
jgi:hypothetical protein